MHVEGNAWLARNDAMERSVGTERWTDFVAAQATTIPFLKTPVLPLSMLPVKDFLLAVHDALAQTFFDGLPKAPGASTRPRRSASRASRRATTRCGTASR